jgi:hypothetical protein|tara:strand:- start:1042 stop:1197 length:156 start_codon:yes stop_codon:yes gene_type:complete
MAITGYKIVYDVIEDKKEYTMEVQAYDLPENARKSIDQYFDSLEEKESEVE